MHRATKKLDRVLEIARMDLARSKNRAEIDNELEIIFSDLYEYIQTMNVNINYYEDKLRSAIITAKIASGLVVDEGMNSKIAKNNVVTEIHFLKSRLAD